MPEICPHCNESFNNPNNYKRHVESQICIIDRTCYKCGKYFSTNQNYNTHLKKPCTFQNQCIYCKSTFNSVVELHMHYINCESFIQLVKPVLR